MKIDDFRVASHDLERRLVKRWISERETKIAQNLENIIYGLLKSGDIERYTYIHKEDEEIHYKPYRKVAPLRKELEEYKRASKAKMVSIDLLTEEVNGLYDIINTAIDLLEGDLHDFDWRQNNNELLRKLGEHLESLK